MSRTLRTTRSQRLSPAGMANTFKAHWPEYLIEALCLAFFMLSACTFTLVLSHPASLVVQGIPNQDLRRLFMGLAMGTTAIAIIFSPFGKRSGAHINPAVTLTYLRLGKVPANDAAFYTLFQFIGAIVGVLLASVLFGPLLAQPEVNYAVTIPGPHGVVPAFVAEVVISCLLMTVVLNVSNTPRLSRWTGLFAGALVATYITLVAPISGMSMNPARSLGSATVANVFTSLWIYLTAPLIGMLLAAEFYLRFRPNQPVACAKLHHHNNQRCIFNCNFGVRRPGAALSQSQSS